MHKKLPKKEDLLVLTANFHFHLQLLLQKVLENILFNYEVRKRLRTGAAEPYNFLGAGARALTQCGFGSDGSGSNIDFQHEQILKTGSDQNSLLPLNVFKTFTLQFSIYQLQYQNIPTSGPVYAAQTDSHNANIIRKFKLLFCFNILYTVLYLSEEKL
jgi:hypothetical protein